MGVFQNQDWAAPEGAGIGRKPLAWAIISRNLAEKFLPHHVIPQFDRARVALGVGAAMGLDDDAVKPQEDAAAGPRPHFRPQRRERLAREQKADSRHKAIAHRVAYVLAELPGGALGGLERDVAGEAFGDENVDRAFAEVVAFDKAVIAHVGQVGLAQHAGRRPHLFDALDLLDPDVEEADRRTVDIEHDARHRRAHHRQIDEMLRVAANGRADVEHDQFAAQGRPHRRDRGSLDRRHRMQAEFRHRHQCAGVAGRDRAIGRARLHRFDRLPHR